MSNIDWIVLFGTLLMIVAYGTWKTRKSASLDSYFRGDNDMSWFTIGLSVMATQASAITFLSAPGLGYEQGLRFVQFYFGLPIAIIIISAFILPIYYRLKVYTAYEYLEGRFNLNVRLLAAFLFLIQRGLAAGLTIFAPAIILSTILGWDLNFTNLFVGILVIIYTVSGGSKAVSLTQKWQMSIILFGMFMAFVILLNKISDFTDLPVALELAGTMGRLEALDFNFDWNERYTVWSGLTGGLFLSLSYFGTDQSQVQRYISGRSLKESRLGLIFNALIKIPMQFFILFIGVLVFVFYLYVKPPIFFNQTALNGLKQSEYAGDLEKLQQKFDANYTEIKLSRESLSEKLKDANMGDEELSLAKAEFQNTLANDKEIRGELKELLIVQDPNFKVKDTNYVFLSFVMDYLPIGLVGLIIALIFSAAMSSTSGELNALATTTSVDFYKRLIRPNCTEKEQLRVSKGLTIFWGILAVGFALSAQLFDNLIEMVNVLGSLFYGTILGLFVVAFFLKWVQSSAVLISAIIAELFVLGIHFAQVYKLEFIQKYQVEYLWYNVIGCVIVVVLSIILQAILPKPSQETA